MTHAEFRIIVVATLAGLLLALLAFLEGSSVFRWGIHFKLRIGQTWRHLVVKIGRSSAFGKKHARHSLWIGWWRAAHGKRGYLAGWRFTIAADRLPAKPSEKMNVPFFPRKARWPEREFEVR